MASFEQVDRDSIFARKRYLQSCRFSGARGHERTPCFLLWSFEVVDIRYHWFGETTLRATC
jgi:hypothetical protein